MSKFGGLRKHENNQHALVPPKTGCGCPSGEEFKKRSHTLPPPMETRRNKIKYGYNDRPCQGKGAFVGMDNITDLVMVSISVHVLQCGYNDKPCQDKWVSVYNYGQNTIPCHGKYHCFIIWIQ